MVLTFASGRGHQQIIAGYYDHGVAQNVDQWKRAADGIKGVYGFMYTTWHQDYDALEDFANRLRGATRLGKSLFAPRKI